MIRKQIVVPPDGLPMPVQDIERIISFAGTIDGLPETLSEQVDAILYGG